MRYGIVQKKGGESRITRHNKTRKNVNSVKKKDEQSMIYYLMKYFMYYQKTLHSKMA